ncbi:hypothetical protein MY04_3361 [Flammeovirga sp. MY04]|uniref:fibronectin type III domain-containing protein n=1 Tax=Flammeovirga sp. MY04 TaxID=1191459 RepID=UPI0008242ACB|nr:hypothetical protein [Flammeovirga sp. MY04]ANQ50723.2 hypothetical protein MY04_3361 [Flammeovirga sp. MY04]
MKTFNSITLFILVFMTSLSVYGQRYPVQLTFMVTPPYPIRLSDYAQVGNTKVQSSIWLKDLSQPDLPVKLRLRIENSQKRLILETKPSYSPEPIHLIGGQTEILDGSVLGQYFELNNLTALSGSTSSIINNGGRLPDGYYKFSLEVLDYYTGRKISNTSVIQCFLVLSDPPLLVMPMDKQKVIVTEPQFINFSWTPRHLASPNKPQNVTYRFQIVEILRDNQPAGDAFASTNPIVDEEGISVPAYQLTALDAPLFPGNKYGWRVQAYDEDENGLIKNNGWSEPRMFQFGDACTECEDFAIANTTHSRAELIWSGKIEHSTYEVRYRRQATEDDEEEIPWKTEEFNTDQAIIKPLSDNTTYEFQVRGLCPGNQKGNWSETKTANAESKPESTYSCEGGEVIIAWENSDPLTTPMKVGEQFTAGDFDVTVVEDDVNNGTHSGVGMIRIQAFNKVFFNVEWDDITVNTDNRLIDGEALVTGSDTDIIPEDIANAIMAGLDVLDQVLEEAEKVAKFIENIFDNLPEDIKNELNKTKEELADAEEELANAKDALKGAKSIGDEDAIAASKELVDQAKENKSLAKENKKQAINKALETIKNEFKKGLVAIGKLKDNLVDISKEKDPINKQNIIDEGIANSEDILSFFQLLDGQTELPENIPTFNDVTDSLAAIEIFTILEEGGMTIDNGELTKLPIAIENVRRGIWAFKNRFKNYNSDDLITSNDTTALGDSTTSQIVANVIISKDIKKGDKVTFGPIAMTLNSDPISISKSNNLLKYKIEKTSFILPFKNSSVGEYSIEISNATITYEIDSTTESLSSADIEWSNDEGLNLDFSFIDADLKEVDLHLDNEGKLTGDLDFSAHLADDKLLLSSLRIKKGFGGDFSFSYANTENYFDGSFNFSNLSSLNAEYVKGEDVIASVSDAKLSNDGELNLKLSLATPLKHNYRGVDMTLDEFDADIDISLKDTLTFNSLKSKLKVENITGVTSTLNLNCELIGDQITTSLTNTNNIEFYGFKVNAETVEASFDKHFNFLGLEIKNTSTEIDKKITFSGQELEIKGNLDIAKISIETTEADSLLINEVDLSGSLNLNNDLATLSLSSSKYEETDSTLSLVASITFKDQNNYGSIYFDQIKINKSGEFTVKDAGIQFITNVGPVKVEFEKQLANTQNITIAKAKVTSYLYDEKEKVIDSLFIETDVEYTSNNNKLSYLKIESDSLNIDVHELYSVNSTINGYEFEYTKTENKDIYKGEVKFKVNLNEDKFLNESETVVLKKGVEGYFSLGYNSDSTKIAYLDFSNIQKLNIDLLKGDKVYAAIENASLDKKGILKTDITLKANNIEYKENGYDISLTALSGNISVDFINHDYKFNSLTATAKLNKFMDKEVPLELSCSLNDTTIIANVSGNEKIDFYGMKVTPGDLKAGFDHEFVFQGFNGQNVEGTYEKNIDGILFKGDFTIEKIDVIKDTLKNLEMKGNLQYGDLASLALSNAVYNDSNQKISLNAKVTANQSSTSNNMNLSFEKIIIDKEGNITIGAAGGEGVLAYGPIKLEFSQELQELSNPINAEAKVIFYIQDSTLTDSVVVHTDVTYQQKEGEIIYAKVELKDKSIDFPEVYDIESKVTSFDIEYKKENETKTLEGNVTFNGSLTKDISYQEDKVILKKGLEGTFKYVIDYNSSDPTNFGYFNFGGLSKINVDFKKDNKVFAKITNASVNSNGVVSSNFHTTEELNYSENNLEVTLKSLKGKVEFNWYKRDFKLLQVEGMGEVNNLPGSSAKMNFSLGINNSKIYGSLSDIDSVNIYGLNMDAKKIGVVFNDQFDLISVSGNNINASYVKSLNGKKLSGNILIDEFLYKEEEIKTFKGSGEVAYDPFAKIELISGVYNSEEKVIEFSASVDLAANENNQAKTTISGIKIHENGEYEIGEVSVDAFAQAGPVSVKFKSEPSITDNISKAEAEVTLVVKKGDIDNSITYSTEVEYTKDSQKGFTYLKINSEDLNQEFPEIYGINTKVKDVLVNYEIVDDKPVYSGSITFSASLEEDKYIYKELVQLKKGIGGTMSISFDSKVEGYFKDIDLSELSGLNIVMLKQQKEIAKFTGSIARGTLLNGRFSVTQPQSVSMNKFNATLNRFDVEATYDFSEQNFTFNTGSGDLKVDGIKGLEGDILLGIDYNEQNIAISLSSETKDLKFCKMNVENPSFTFEVDDNLNLTKIEGSFGVKPEGMSSAITLSDLLIIDGEVKSVGGKANIDYKNFRFDILSASYNSITGLDMNAKVLLGDSYVEVESFKIDNNGIVSVGKAKGDFNKSLMAIRFDATFNENRFQGSFDATISRKLSITGTVDMGTSECDNCNENNSFNYGYFKLKVGAPIPVFPGVSISQLGGQFGYNYFIDFDDRARYGTPRYNNYIAGFSFGLQDQAGMLEFAVDPAVYQWGDESAMLYLNGTIKAPKIDPVFEGNASMTLELPSYDITGELNAKVNIPAKSGLIFKADQKIDYSITSTKTTFKSNQMDAKVFKVVTFTGNFSNERNYRPDGSLISADGVLNGELSYNYKGSYSDTYLNQSFKCNFDFTLSGNLNTTFTDSNFNTQLISVGVSANASLEISTDIGDINPKVSLDANALFKPNQDNWKLETDYKLKIGEGILSYEHEGNYSMDLGEITE